MEETKTQSSTTLEPPWEKPDELSPGSAIGRFVVLGTLGSGGMGVVLSAYDPVLERRVARAIVARARCDLQDGHAAAAVERLVHAVAIDDKTHADAGTLGGHRSLLAEGLWANGERDAATIAARKADAEMANAPGAELDLASLRTWMTAHAVH